MKPTLKALCAVSTLTLLAACSSSSDSPATDGPSAETPAPAAPAAPDPLLESWQLKLAGRYVRVAETRTTAPVTVWPAPGLLDTSGGPSQPAYADIQQVRFNDNWVYVSTSGLASHPMGPWYWNADTLFGNWPRAQGLTVRLPRRSERRADNEVAAIGLGPQGIWVNGVPFFNQLDGAYYSTAAGREMQEGPSDSFGSSADKIWIRDAIPVEGPTFDASNAHQPPIGQYHYHSNPLALRFQLGDNVAWQAASGRYVEATGAKHHSPILGWARDGFPIYGPYGYADCSGTATDVRRLRSGYVLRDGRQGSTDLRVDGRKSLGRWAAFLHQLPTTAVDASGRVALDESLHGPDIGTRYYLGRYNEDWEFLGDLGRGQGADFDLDVHNGRDCRTPEYPEGTYAYYVTLNEDGSGAYPYTVGRQLRGSPLGGTVTAATEPEVLSLHASSPLAEVLVPEVTQDGSSRVVQWAGAEGAQYSVAVSTDGALTWRDVAATVAIASPGADATPGGSGLFSDEPLKGVFVDRASYASEPAYRVTRTAIAANSNGPVGATKGQIVAVTPAAFVRGETARLSVRINGNQPIVDIDPDSSVKPDRVDLVSLDGQTVIATGSNILRTLESIQADVTVPADAAPGSYMALIFFNRGAGQTFRSVNQLDGVAEAQIAPSPASYPDLPVTVD